MYCEQCKHLIDIVGGDELLCYCEVSGNVIYNPDRYGRFCTSKEEEDG